MSRHSDVVYKSNMYDSGLSQPCLRLTDVRLTLRQLQDETISLVSPGLYVGGVILIAAERQFQDPLQSGLPALILFLLPIVVWALRKLNYLASAWTLVFGCLVADLLVVVWGNVDAAIYLLALPVGLAALFISVVGGTLTATACTFFLLYAPATLLTPDRALRVVALMGMWGMVGLTWLTLRPLLTAMQWYWSTYERNRRLLEQARDSQMQLKQTLEDLADANLQLTRLNRLAQAMRQAAEEARRAKEQFVANVSHELRTPLNMIIGFSEMIVQAPEVYSNDIPSTLLADLDVILRNSQYLSRLIDDVLDLSQIEAKQMALTKERVPFRDIVEAAMIAVRPLFDSKGLRLEAEIQEELPPVFCDHTRIRQVMLNLLSNAGRFTECGGVHVRAWQDGQHITTSVADTGPGIPAKAMDRLFQPFHQLDSSIRRHYGGSGLGLSISKRFIELHGGKVWFESEEGIGTTFFFRLPIDRPVPIDSNTSRWFSPYLQHEERTWPSMAPVPVIRPRFIVLETGHALQRLLTRYLDGAEIVPVTSLPEAIQGLTHMPTQALLVNDMSVSKTLQCFSECTALPYGTPAIICSVPGACEAAGALGISDYLVKPVSRDALLAALDRLKLKGKTLLVVDDETEALRLFRRMLISSERGYRVLRATDGRRAMNILCEQRVNAILLDLVMPKMDGFRFLAEKSQDPALRKIPVVVISARDPAGQPIVSNALAVTQRGGLSMPQLLACAEAISRILSTAGQAGGPVPTRRLAD